MFRILSDRVEVSSITTHRRRNKKMGTEEKIDHATCSTQNEIGIKIRKKLGCSVGQLRIIKKTNKCSDK